MPCPVTYIIDEIIGVDELRQIIGGPTDVTTEIGHILDDLLCDIIQRHHDALVEQVDRIIGELVDQGQPPGPPEVFELVMATPDGAPYITDAHHFDIDTTTYYPWARTVYDTVDGTPLDWDAKFFRTLHTSFTTIRRFFITNATLYWADKAHTNLDVFFPNLTELRRFHASGDMITKTNERIIQDAYRALQRRIQEGARQEGTIFNDDDLLGNTDQSIT